MAEVPLWTRERRGIAILMGMAACLFCILQPWLRPFSLQPFDYQRWVEAFSLACLVPLSISWAVLVLRQNRLLLFLAVSSVLLVFFSGFLNGSHLFLNVLTLRALLWVLVLLGAIFSWGVVSFRVKCAFSAFVMAVLLAYVAYTLVGVFSAVSEEVYDRGVFVFGFSNINHAAGFFLVSILLMPALTNYIAVRGKSFNFLAYAIGSGMAFFLVLIGSRGAFLAWVVTVLVTFLYRRKGIVDKYLCWLLLTAAVGFLVYLLLQLLVWSLGIDQLVSKKSIFADSGRFMLYKAAWLGFLEAPWLGNGPLSYAALIDLQYAHAHNFFLTLLYEYGALVGASVLAIFFAGTLSIFKRRFRILKDPVALPGVLTLVAFFVYSQFSGLLLVPSTVIFVLLAMAFAFSDSPFFVNVHAESDQPVICGALFWGISLVACYLILVAHYWQSVETETLQKPRFWLNGGTEAWLSGK